MKDVVVENVVFGVLKEYLDAKDGERFWPISEVSINGPGGVWIEFWGRGYEYVPDKRVTLEWIRDVCTQLARYHHIKISRAVGIVACRLRGGHRFQGIVGEMANGGGAISIRVKRPFRATVKDFGVDAPKEEILREACRRGDNIMIVGGTSAGKTTLFNCLVNYIPESERIITVEDAQELEILQPNHVGMVMSRAEGGFEVVQHLINNLVRMNPYRILGGEVSVHNLFGFINALNTGHKGFMTTMHANSPLEALEGARMRLKLAGHDPSGCIEFLARNINLIVQVQQMEDGKRRVTDVVRPIDLPWRSLVGGIEGGAMTAHVPVMPWFTMAGGSMRSRLRARLDQRLYGGGGRQPDHDLTRLLDPIELSYIDSMERH